MATTIFDQETEIGKCDSDWLQARLDLPRSTTEATIYAHTVGSFAGSNKLLKIEHRCYVRAGEALPDQPWVKPQLRVESALPSLHANRNLIRQVHRAFVQSARAQLPEDCLELSPPAQNPF